MYANIYQMRTNKYNIDKNNYISSLNQKINYHPNKTNKETYLNKRTNSTKYMNQANIKQNYINYDASKNIPSKAKPLINRRVNSSM
jgi:hypothetical protein